MTYKILKSTIFTEEILLSTGRVGDMVISYHPQHQLIKTIFYIH